MEAGLFRFLRFSLGLEGEVKDLLDGRKGCFDWEACYQFAKRQTLVGVLFDGIQRLPKELAPARPLLLHVFSSFLYMLLYMLSRILPLAAAVYTATEKMTRQVLPRRTVP